MLAVQMDTFPFHWDSPDATQCLRMACLCPDEYHEGLRFLQDRVMKHVLLQTNPLRPVFLQKLAFIISFPSVWFCDMIFVFTGLADSYFTSFQSMSTTAPPPEYTLSGG